MSPPLLKIQKYFRTQVKHSLDSLKINHDGPKYPPTVSALFNPYYTKS